MTNVNVMKQHLDVTFIAECYEGKTEVHGFSGPCGMVIHPVVKIGRRRSALRWTASDPVSGRNILSSECYGRVDDAFSALQDRITELGGPERFLRLLEEAQSMISKNSSSKEAQT